MTGTGWIGRRAGQRVLALLGTAIWMGGCPDTQIVVYNTPPVVSITTPGDGDTIYPGRVSFQGTVADNQDDVVDLEATFLLSGAMEAECPAEPQGNGTVTCEMDLDEGEYTLVLYVVDSENEPGQDQVSFQVANAPPSAVIVPPDRTTFYEGELVLLEGDVSDPEEPPERLEVVWTSSLVPEPLATPTPSADGYVTLARDDLPAGTHQIGLTVTDPLGRSDTAQVAITIQACPDEDGDGFSPCLRDVDAVDCNDNDPATYPGAEEICDALDNDCDFVVDEGFDDDGDGYRDEQACDLPGTPLDCDDDNAAVHPDAPEKCNGIDDNCNGEVDEDVDADGDGMTPCGGDCDDSNPTVYAGADEVCDGLDNDCDPDGAVDEGFDADNDGYTACGGDCDDNDPAVNPAQLETCNRIDDDCDGLVDEDFDLDGDGFTTCGIEPALQDCDDTSPTVYPGAVEACNQIDDDCDGIADEDDDQDGDGFTTCGGPDGLADCDDTNPAANPEATEKCNGFDDDCNGEVDEGFDLDNDGYVSCIVGGTPKDCNDNDATIHPNADEHCNHLDDDCDGLTDEGFDQDDDGYLTCEPQADCNDHDPSSHPGAEELCDGADNDCDGLTDEGFDQDGDGYPACALGDTPADCNDRAAAINPGAVEQCDSIDNDCDGDVDEGFDQDNDGYNVCGGDCDDDDPAVNPRAQEICNGIDDDCNGEVDEGFDQDNDGYTDCAGDCAPADPGIHPNATELCNNRDDDCDGATDEGFDQDGDGFKTCDNDCDDADPAVNPGVSEACNGVDDDCDGTVDEGFDQDHDGFTSCNGDCNDTDPSIEPTATEICNGADDDCDGEVDEGFDRDGDGFKTCDNDCDDADPAVNPGVSEACNGVDDDCDGEVDEPFDTDHDGYPTCAIGGRPADCDDDNATIHPGAPELCNGVDDDCDGLVDGGFDTDGDGVTVCDGDCDDNDAGVYPGAQEVCNGVDDDCDNVRDEGFDDDQDGVPRCAVGSVPADCDDTDPLIRPGMSETCNEVDDDCDGEVDEGFDQDGDGVSSCSGDCDDGDATVYAGALESCNGVDDDCDGAVDEGLTSTYHRDADGDTFGDPATSLEACTMPSGYVVDATDCDDTDPTTYPGADESAGDGNGDGVPDGDGKDNDCDGLVDEGTDLFDDDGDGYREVDGDCDDDDDGVNPGVPEATQPDGIDNDCDGLVDEGTEVFDDDGDGYREVDDDCDDDDPWTYPGAPERFDGKDNNCDGVVESEIQLADAFSFVGHEAGTLTGMSAAGIGDVDGSGTNALAVGAPGTGLSAGAVHVLLTADLEWGDDLDLAARSVTLWEDNIGAYTGYSVAGALDLNQDGYDDFVIGAPFFSTDTLTNAGVTYVVMGRSSGWGNSLVSDFATSAVKAVSSENYLGISVAGGGDVNNDGYPDVLIGVPWPSGTGGGAGWVLVLNGKERGWSPSLAPTDLAKLTGKPAEGVGWAVAITGYTTGDSACDILAGGTFDTESRGDAWFLYGRTDFEPGTVFGPDKLGGARYRGVTSQEFVGAYVAGAGDVNGDGYDDFLVGRETDGNGFDAKAYLYFGPNVPGPGTAEATAPVRFYGSSSDQCPCTVAGLGDIDGDGYDDLAIGVTRSSERNGGGTVYLFYGGPDGTFSQSTPLSTTDMAFYGEAAGDQAGTALSAAGDLNGDGYDDFVVGAPFNDQNGTDAGKVYILFGHPR